MGFWQRWFGGAGNIGGSGDVQPEAAPPVINPATGLPMTGEGSGGVDAGGSPFGIDVHQPPVEPPSYARQDWS